MSKNSGIFKIITDNCIAAGRCTLGTAFAIKIWGEDNKYYLLTAYHVISELSVKKLPIIVIDEEGRCYSAEKIFPETISAKYREFGRDYAVLIMYSDIHYQTYEIMDYSERVKCYVRGSIPHYTTVFTSINGNILGRESIVNQNKVLQLSLDTRLVFDEDSKAIPEQKILQGLSGAPVFVEIEEKAICVGVLSNLERDSAGSVKYAVLMKTIIEECLDPLHIPYKIFERKNNNIDSEQKNETFIELILENTDDFIFAEESLEQEAWNKVSDLFYKGMPVDSLLKEIIESNGFIQYSAEIRCTILYFYARILFKRSRRNDAFRIFQEISQMFPSVSQQTKEKLNVLIDSRSIIERKIEIPKETLRSIRYVGDKITNLSNASNEFIAYELASIYGRGLTNLFADNMDFSVQDKEELKKIYIAHENLLNSNLDKLYKQDVVNTSLQWYLGYWGIDKTFDLQKMDSAVRNGFIQSKKRKNNIFYIQSMISYGILKVFDNKNVDAVRILLLSVKLMHDKKIGLIHEGIRQLLLILKEKNLAIYAMFKLAYEIQQEELFLSKVELYRIDLENYSWGNILRQCNDIYILKFDKQAHIYNVDFEELKFFLE